MNAQRESLEDYCNAHKLNLIAIYQDDHTGKTLHRFQAAFFESGKSVPHESTAEALQTARENRGIVFSNGDKPTVQLDRSRAIIPT